MGWGGQLGVGWERDIGAAVTGGTLGFLASSLLLGDSLGGDTGGLLPLQ